MEKSFEEELKGLEKIVNELENGDLPLEESIKKFEEGIKMSKYCNDILDKAEKRIVTVLEKNGEIAEEELK